MLDNPSQLIRCLITNCWIIKSKLCGKILVQPNYLSLKTCRIIKCRFIGCRIIEHSLYEHSLRTTILTAQKWIISKIRDSDGKFKQKVWKKIKNNSNSVGIKKTERTKKQGRSTNYQFYYCNKKWNLHWNNLFVQAKKKKL